MDSKEPHGTNKNPNKRHSEPTEGIPHEFRPIPVDKIRVAECCQRSEYKTALDSLKESIDRRGLIQNPVVVDKGDGTYILIAGSRRLLACRSLGWKEILCRIQRTDAREAAFISFAENAVRIKPHPVDEARFLRRIKNATKMTDTQIATEVGLPQSGVTERLSILDLSDDVLAQIDTRPESAFRLTHAVLLSQLARTDRINRKVEIEQLQAKTIQHRLSSTELKRLVQFIKSGEYDRLPRKTQTLLMNSSNMDSKMAQLFLHSERWIEGDGSDAEQLRKKASELSSESLESLIESAVANKWSESDIKKRLARLIKLSDSHLSKREGGKRAKSVAENLSSDMLSLLNKLQMSQNKIASVAASDREGLLALRQTATELMCQIQSFLGNLAETIS